MDKNAVILFTRYGMGEGPQKLQLQRASKSCPPKTGRQTAAVLSGALDGNFDQR